MDDAAKEYGERYLRILQQINEADKKGSQRKKNSLWLDRIRFWSEPKNRLYKANIKSFIGQKGGGVYNLQDGITIWHGEHLLKPSLKDVAMGHLFDFRIKQSEAGYSLSAVKWVELGTAWIDEASGKACFAPVETSDA